MVVFLFKKVGRDDRCFGKECHLHASSNRTGPVGVLRVPHPRPPRKLVAVCRPSQTSALSRRRVLWLLSDKNFRAPSEVAAGRPRPRRPVWAGSGRSGRPLGGVRAQGSAGDGFLVAAEPLRLIGEEIKSKTISC